MTRYTPQWVQAGSYAASQDRRLIGALWPNPASFGCLVGSPNGMLVNIAPGQVAVPTQNNTGATLCTSDANEQVTLTAAPPSGVNRVDLVICRPRANDLDGGANTDFIFDVVTGVAGSPPAAVPATPAGTVALAQILVPGGSASIAVGNITDVRPSGLAVPGGGLVVARAPMGAVTLSGLTPIPLAAATFDTLGGFTSAGYTVKMAGYYLIGLVLTVVGVPASNGPIYRIQKNGADLITGNFYNGGSNTQNFTLTLTELAPLAVGDVIRPACGNTAGSVAASTGALTLNRIGG